MDNNTFQWIVVIILWLVGNGVTRWVVNLKNLGDEDYPFWAYIFWPVKLFCALVMPVKPKTEEKRDDSAFFFKNQD